MSDFMLLSTLRLPVPDDPSKLDAVVWMSLRQAMRDAADEIEARGFCLDERDAALAAEYERTEAIRVEYDERLSLLDADIAKLREALGKVRQAIMWGKDALPIIDAVLAETGGGDNEIRHD